MLIVIPTYRRCTAAKQTTWSHIPPGWRKQVRFVVSDEADARGMRAAIGPNTLRDSGAEILVAPPMYAGSIAQKRAWILSALDSSDHRLVMFDDDLRITVRVDDTSTKLRPATHDDVDQQLTKLHAVLGTYAHAGWSARQGNNHLEWGWAEVGRQVYSLGYRTDVVRQFCALGRIETREDMDLTLQLLRLGYANTVCASIACDQTYNAPGGCSESRTVEASNADAHKLAELHPGYVKVVDKAYEGSVPRQEVVVSWKKAFWDGAAQGQRRPEALL